MMMSMILGNLDLVSRHFHFLRCFLNYGWINYRSLMSLLNSSFYFGPWNLSLSRHHLRVKNLNLIRFFPLLNIKMSCGELDDFHDL